MPSIDQKFLLQLHDDYRSYPCFVETGTYCGDTIFKMEPLFQDLYTVEIAYSYYTATSSRYHGNKIQFLYGDSSDIFQTLLPTLTQPTIFFLDGHYSSGDTGKGKKDIPLLEELQLINTLYKQEGIVIIDDVRLFGKSPATGLPEDWSEISTERLLNILQQRIKEYYFMDSCCSNDDRLVIHIGPFVE